MAQLTETVAVDVKRKGNSLGVASMMLGTLAFLICWIPLLGMLGIPLSALGLLLGGLGVLIALVRRGASIGYPIAGVTVSGLAIVVAGSMTNAIFSGLSDVNQAMAVEQRERDATNQVVVNPESPSATTPGTANVPGASASQTQLDVNESPQWASAEYPVQQGDIQLQFVSAEVGNIEIKRTHSSRGRVSHSENELLAIHVEITNLSETKKIDYRTWAGGDISFGGDFATLQDEYGNTYKRIRFGLGSMPVGRVRNASIRPGEPVTDILVFERPIDAAKMLRLELSAKNFGGEGMMRIEIPIDRVE